MEKIKSLIRKYFGGLEVALHTLILLFVPLITLFSVMSDRNPYNYINIALYVVEIILIIFYVWKFKYFRFDILAFCIVLFNLTILISQILNKRISEYPTTILLLSVFSVIFYQFVIHEENKTKIYRLILIGGLLFAAYFIYTYFIKPTTKIDILSVQFGDRLGDDFADQNDLAKYLAIFGILSLIEYFKAKRWLKILPILSFGLFTFLVLITGSVSNLLCLVIVSLFVLIFCSKRKNRLIVLFSVLAIGATIFGLMQLPFLKYFKERIDGIFNAFFDQTEKVDGSATDRIKLFLEGFRLFLTRPFFGFGYDQIQYYTHGIGQFSHSNVVELLGSFGVVGFLAFETLIVYPLYYAYNNDHYKTNAFFTLLYLFVFQFFLIIFRKKIEFMLIPLGFSSIVGADSKAIELSFKRIKPTFTKVGKVKPSPNKNVLFVSSENGNNVGITRKVCARLCDKNFDLKTCIITSDMTKNNFDYSVEKSKSKWSLKRKLADVLDDVNPVIIIVSQEEVKLVQQASFGKNTKILCYIQNDSKIVKKNYGSKVYKILEGDIKNNEQNNRKLDNRVLFVKKFSSKKEFNNLISLLK